jgi:ABC-type uncharacterized transport system substrate-binding protein
VAIVTGLSQQVADLAGKRLELLREVIPGLRRLAVLVAVGNPAVVMEMREVQAAAFALGLELITLEIERSEDIAPAFEALKGRAEAVFLTNGALLVANRVRISTLALAARLPVMVSLVRASKRVASWHMGQVSRTCTGAQATMSIRYCAAQSRPTYRSSSRPSSI